MNTSLSSAGRLIATESAFFAAKGEYDNMKDLGVEKYQFVATLDSRTSETCRAMDMKIIPMKDFKPGVTAPPLHCWCRSCTVPYMDEMPTGFRAARDERGYTTHVEGMKYADWKAIYVDRTKTLEEWREEHKPDILKPEGIPKAWKAITGEHDIEADIKAANPLYSQGKPYKYNCQRCVQALELRQRGYDVVAMPAPPDGEASPVEWGAECFAQPAKGETVKEAARKMFTAGQTKASVEKELKNAPDGARYVIYVRWKKQPGGEDPGAHVFIAQKEQGTVRYLDPQLGRTDVEWYFDLGRNGQFGFCRIDDKPLTEDEVILSATAKPR